MVNSGERAGGAGDDLKGARVWSTSLGIFMVTVALRGPVNSNVEMFSNRVTLVRPPDPLKTVSSTNSRLRNTLAVGAIPSRPAIQYSLLMLWI